LDFDAQKFILYCISTVDLKAEKNIGIWIWAFQISETMSDSIIPNGFYSGNGSDE
jgi:hypothetical protein